MKSKSEKGFLDFLSSVKPSFKIGAVLLVGLLLILLSGLGGERTVETADEEERLAEMCSLIEGVGECRVMMTYRPDTEEQQVYAVLVLCEGGDSVSVRERITSLFCSLYGIGSHRVEIQRLAD